jgi:thioredoxin-related protein
MKKYALLLFSAAAAGLLLLTLAFTTGGEKKSSKIKWMTFTEAVEACKKNPKKIYIDVYTDWCGWCKKMEATSFDNEVIAKYMNEKYYAVKLNAEMKDTIVFNNYTFVNPNPTVKGSVHQLAASLLSNKMAYPTSVFLDENFGMLQPIQSYLDAKTLEMVLKFYGEEANKTTSWDDFQKSFVGEVK